MKTARTQDSRLPSTSSLSDMRAGLDVLLRTLEREAHVLAREPDLVASHLHNSLFLDEGTDGVAGPLLLRARDALSHRPWLRLTDRPRVPGRGALLRTVEHGAWVQDVGWEARDDVLASSALDQTVAVWDARTGRRRATIEATSGFVWAPVEPELAVWGNGAEIRIFDPYGGLTGRIDLGPDVRSVTAVVWADEGSELLAGTSTGVVLAWDRASDTITILASDTGAGNETALLSPVPVARMVLAPHGDRLAVEHRSEDGSGDPSIRLWERRDGSWRPTADLRGRRVAWALDGGRLAAISSLNNLQLYDASGADLGTDGQGRGTRGCVDWSPTGMVAVGSFLMEATQVLSGYGLLDVFDPDRDVRHPLTPPIGSIKDVAWSSDGETLAFGGAPSGDVAVWRESGLIVLGGHASPVSKVSWAHDGKRFASASQDGTILLWDTTRRPPDERSQSEELEKRRARLKRAVLASTILLNLVLWVGVPSAWWWFGFRRVASGSWPIWAYPLMFVGMVLSMGVVGWFMHRFHQLVDRWAGRASLAVARDPPDGAHRDRVTVGAWSPDGSVFASGGRDNQVSLWSPLTGECLATYPGTTSPDLYGYVDRVEDLAWSLDGALLAIGRTAQSDHQALHIWEPDTGKVWALRSDSVSLRAVAWSANGKRLFVRDDDGRVQSWDVSRLTREPAHAWIDGSGGVTGWPSARPPPQAGVPLRDESAVAWPDKARARSSDGKRWAIARGRFVVVEADGVEGPIARALCLSEVIGLRFESDGRSIRVADDGGASGNRPFLYVFTLSNT